VLVIQGKLAGNCILPTPATV